MRPDERERFHPNHRAAPSAPNPFAQDGSSYRAHQEAAKQRAERQKKKVRHFQLPGDERLYVFGQHKHSCPCISSHRAPQRKQSITPASRDVSFTCRRAARVQDQEELERIKKQNADRQRKKEARAAAAREAAEAAQREKEVAARPEELFEQQAAERARLRQEAGARLPSPHHPLAHCRSVRVRRVC